MALIGTTISPYMQLYAASGVVGKGAGAADYPRARIDAVSGAVFACCISLTIIIATAAAIGGNGPLSCASQAALALRPVAGPAAEGLFAVGLIGASALAGAVVPLSSRSLPGDAANGPVFRVAATVVVAGVSGMSLLLLATTVLGSFGIG